MSLVEKVTSQSNIANKKIVDDLIVFKFSRQTEAKTLKNYHF